MLKTLAFVLMASLGACAGRAEYSASATMPSMVAVSPGSDVQVVTDVNEPTFYTDHSFWLYRDGQWYRSHDHRGGWVHVDVAPEKIRRIDNPVAYVHFHGHLSPTANAYNQAQPSEDMPGRDRPLPEQPPMREPSPQAPTQPPIPNAPLPQNQVPPAPDSTTPGAPQPDRIPDVPRMQSMNDTVTPVDQDKKDATDKNPSDSK